jgi:lipopolysaccharide transport system permease protein
MSLANPFSSLYRHRDLIVQFTRREIEVRHKGSRLGHLWAVLRPLSMLVLYFFIFGYVFNGSFGVVPGETRVDFALGIFMGLNLFIVVAEAMGAAPLLIVNQPNFVKKVVFPLEVIPLSSVATSLYHSLLSMVLLLAIAPVAHALGLSHCEVNWVGALALPLLLLPLACMSLGIAWGLSAIGIFLRDINQLVPFLSTATMYASAIVYSPDKITSPTLLSIARLNPLLRVVDQARRIVLWNLPANYGDIAYAYGASILILGVGYALFAVLRPYFAEVI